ncbi:MAG: hypothetical protein ACLUIW_09230 [Dysosmobacter welbionis]
MFAAIRQAGQTLLQYDNVKFYGYLMDPEIVTNLDNYCDYIHHSGGVCREILRHASKGGGPPDRGKSGGDPRQLAGICGTL